MQWDSHQLSSLAAVVRTGSFDAAAHDLHITPSAMSQRIKALENAAGQILVRRGRPSVATEAGEVLIRLAGQTTLLEQEAAAELRAGDDGPVRVAIAVNADSLATWFLAVLGDVRARHDVVFDLRQEDESASAELLRDGSVMAAVTAEPTAVQGCTAVPIGSMRYVPMAAPQFHERHIAGADSLAAALSEAPMLNCNRGDSLQHRYARSVARRRVDPPQHFVPSSEAFSEAVRMGLGWGLLPEKQLRCDAADGPDRLIRLDDRHVDVPLYWQHWRLESTILHALSEAVLAHAKATLRHP